MTPAPKPYDPSRNSFDRGFATVIIFHVIQLPLDAMSAGFALMVFGLIQLAYVIPLALKANTLKETARLQGILAAAGLTILLNGICDFNFFHNFNPH